MKNLRAVIAFAFLLACTPAFAQWQTSNHSIPIGRGKGVTGFGAVAPGSAGMPLVSQGASSDPAYGTVSNNGIAAGPADTYKGSLNGTTTTDVPRAPCTGAGQALRYTAGVGESCGNVAVQLGYDMPVNLQLNAAIASNQLTIAVKGINGSDPSPANPVQINFRDAASTGTLVTGSQQAALSFTLASTSSLGCTTATVCRIWVQFICQTIAAGSCTSILVGASAQSATTVQGCSPIDEAVLATTGPGTNGGTGLATLYTSVASLSGKPIRIAGYIEAIWTSGTGWATPSNIQLFGPGIHRPCETVASKFVTNGSQVSLPNTPFTSTGLTTTITPHSAANIIRAHADLNIGCGSGVGTEQIGRNSNSNLFGNNLIVASTGTQSFGGAVTGYDFPQSTSSTTYTVYGISTATLSCQSNFEAGSSSGLTLEEIMGALEPANDDEPLRMVG